jgi:hypothetical protein
VAHTLHVLCRLVKSVRCWVVLTGVQLKHTDLLCRTTLAYNDVLASVLQGASDTDVAPLLHVCMSDVCRCCEREPHVTTCSCDGV